ncbi:ABC transporter substrate-binding protein [Blastococcus sp. SYSU D00695]
MAVAVVAALGGVLTGCGSDDGEDAAATGSPFGGAFPVTIEHLYGETTIEEEPQRVVTIGLSDQDAVLALGVVPVAVSPWYGEYEHGVWPWAQDELGDGEPVVLNDGVRDEENPPLEEIAALDPDVIISLYNGTTEEQYEQLSEIAPVVLPTEEYADYAISWQESVRVTGKALGREERATELVEGLEQRFADVAAANPAFAGLQTVIAERFEPGSSVVRASADPRGRFFESLGFQVPEDLDARADEFGELVVSDELLDDLDRDLLIWNVGFAPEMRAEIEGLALWPTLDVVRDGRVLFVEDELISGAFTWSTVLSLDYALTELVPQLQSVVAGTA